MTKSYLIITRTIQFNLYFSRTGLSVCLKPKISFIKLGLRLFRDLKILTQSMLRRFTFIDEKPDFNDKSLFDVLQLLYKNFRAVFEDFRLSLEKEHLKTSKLADNN